MKGKLQAYELFELAHLELAPYFFIATLKPTYGLSIAYEQPL
jgi:hypothetical protein